MKKIKYQLEVGRMKMIERCEEGIVTRGDAKRLEDSMRWEDEEC